MSRSNRINVVQSVATPAEWQQLARDLDAAFVVVVQVSAGEYRRRCYFTVSAAQGAAQKAVERGESATVFLCELKPLYKLQGGKR